MKQQLSGMHDKHLPWIPLSYITHQLQLCTHLWLVSGIVRASNMKAEACTSSFRSPSRPSAYDFLFVPDDYPRCVSMWLSIIKISYSNHHRHLAKVSLDRVTEFLNDTELLDEFDSKTEKHDQIDLFTNGPSEPDAIGFSDASFVWTSVDGSLTPSRRKFRLTIEDKLEFKRGALNLIIGPTGSGKTSLLMALLGMPLHCLLVMYLNSWLGEMHFLPSQPTSWYNLPRDKGVAFAAQESWVQNETIRNNILFGTPYDEERYKKGASSVYSFAQRS